MKNFHCCLVKKAFFGSRKDILRCVGFCSYILHFRKPRFDEGLLMDHIIGTFRVQTGKNYKNHD